MFIKRDLIIVVVALLTVALFAGCSEKDSGGDQTSATEVQEQIDQVLGCACHTQYGELLESRHADANNSPNRGSCDPCHTGIDSIGDYIVPDPKYFVDCASCHEPDGTKHGAINANLRHATVATPGGKVFPTCTLCHDFNADDAPYGAHHYLDSYRYWENADGDDPHEGDADADPSVANTTIASVAFSVWSLPAVSGTAPPWNGAYAGPYYFAPGRTIKDTHFNDVWVLNEDDMVTQFRVSTAKFGYVDLTNTSPNGGMVTADNAENACLASCHSTHAFDKTVQQQWADGAHHPTPEGPIIDDGGDPAASGPAAWHAVDHQGFGANCVRCHTSVGFVEANGAYSDSVDLGAWNDAADGFITCNACHDGVDYPTAFNSRLRLNGDAVIFDNGGASVLLTIEDAGPSATCIYCHQGRQNGQYIKDNFATALSTSDFGAANSHYVAAGGIIWTTVGYEYGSSPSAYANVGYYEHDMIGIDDTEETGNSGPCATCHMSGEPSNHFFDVKYGGELPEVCSNCHAGQYAIDLEFVEEEKASYEQALEIIVDELEAQGVFFLGSYPYFFDTSSGGFGNRKQSWSDEELLGAAFNLNLLSTEPGAFTHNSVYTKRLIFDSIDWLDNSTLDGTIADYTIGYPEAAHWLGTTRP